MATVYGIVTQSGGGLRVESKVGQGTTFTICLPCLEQPQSAINGQSNGQDVRSLPQGCETVLLVEAETGVRKLAAGILKMNGYTVLEADNGAKVLEMSEQ